MFSHLLRPDQGNRPPWRALALSVLVHAIALCLPQAAPQQAAPPSVVQATLRPPPVQEIREPQRTPEVRPDQRKKSIRPTRQAPTTQVLRSNAPDAKWSVAEKAEMDNFLNELAGEARARSQPTLAQKARAMARGYGREMAYAEQQESATLELRPNATPPNPFSLEMYLDALVKRLNRSAAYVKNDRRNQGMRKAEVRVRLNPDGSLKSFVVVNQGDQADEIAFVKSVVERAVPFAPFPEDIDKAAKSLAMSICIEPGLFGGSGFGFTKMPSGRGC